MHQSGQAHDHQAMSSMHYRHLAIMIALSFIAMYFLMYAMVDAWPNVFMNFNQVYMAGLMTAAMVVIELGVMWSMYPNKRLNWIVIGVGVAALVAFFLFIRQQTLIGDSQFLRSMISHHASAILMCKQASLRDPDIERLCREIIANQESEIEQMKAKLSQPAA